MQCTKCGSNNVNIQMISEAQLRRKHHGIMYWLFIGWWLELLLWSFLTIPRFLCMLFGHKKQQIKTVHNKTAICQNCGSTWKI